MLVPAVDVLSRDGDLVVRVELPGLDPERDVEISVQDGVLVVRGERRKEERTEGENYVRIESAYGAFQRAIPLPRGVKEEDIKASYENGVLEIVVPGAAESGGSRKIPISASRERQAVSSGSRSGASGSGGGSGSGSEGQAGDRSATGGSSGGGESR